MSDDPQTQPPGWYYAQGDPPGTQRYWDGASWQGGPQPVPGADVGVADSVAGNLAEPIKRIAARFIDGILWVILTIFVGLIFGGSALEVGVIASILVGALIVAYEVVMVGTKGGTVGKLLLGMKVVNEDGSPADYETGLRRMYLYIAFIFIGLIPILGQLLNFVVAIAGLVMLFTDARHQTPWDKVGKTLVVEG